MGFELGMSKQPRMKAAFTKGKAPPGGICLSSFVVVASGPRILVGKMVKPETWVKEFFVGEQYAPGYVMSGKYLMPASHLAWYESPLDAAERVLKEQVLMPISREEIKLVDIQSHVSGEIGNEKESHHWDLCFVYRISVPGSAARKMKKPDWFEDFGFKLTSALSPRDFTRGHGDVLETARVISSTKKHR
jgi:hypothetical protein